MDYLTFKCRAILNYAKQFMHNYAINYAKQFMHNYAINYAKQFSGVEMEEMEYRKNYVFYSICVNFVWTTVNQVLCDIVINTCTWIGFIIFTCIPIAIQLKIALVKLIFQTGDSYLKTMLWATAYPLCAQLCLNLFFCFIPRQEKCCWGFENVPKKKLVEDLRTCKRYFIQSYCVNVNKSSHSRTKKDYLF